MRADPVRAIESSAAQQRWRDYRDRGLHTDERIGWLLTRAAERWPEREAVIFEGERLTFARLQAWTLAAAHYLVARGIGPGDRVLWQLPNCLEGLVLHLAAWRIGAVSVPVVPILAATTLSFKSFTPFMFCSSERTSSV